MELSIMLMEINMKENLKIISKKDMVYAIILVGIYMKDKLKINC